MGGTSKPNFVVYTFRTTEKYTRTIISLCERPILLLHQRGFATPPCHHGANRVALANITILFTFLNHASTIDSIVSVVLSLGLRDASRRRSGRSPVRVTVCRVAVSNTLFHDELLHQGCSDFPQALRPVTVLYPQRFPKYSRF